MLILNQRIISILKHLLDAEKPIKVHAFAEDLSCSERTIRSDIDILNTWLLDRSFSLVENVYGKGLVYKGTSIEKEQVQQTLSKLNEESYDFNREERIKLITFLLLSTNTKTTINQLKDFFYVSRTSILKDLDIIEQQLTSNNLVLKRVPRVGVWVEGEEFHIRSGLIHAYKGIDRRYLQTIIAKFTNANSKKISPITLTHDPGDMMGELKIDKINQLISPLLDMIGVQLSDDAKATLYLHIGMSLKRIYQQKVIELDEGLLSNIKTKKEFELARLIKEIIEIEFNVHLPNEEVGYITLHLLGKQNSPNLKIDETKMEDDVLSTYIEKMIEQVASLTTICFENEEQLMEGLFVHLKPAIYRAKYGMTTENPLAEEIKTNYTHLYYAVSVALKEIENFYQILFNREEIAYITMHFGSALPVEPVNIHRPLHILIVCSSGVGTAQLLRREMMEKFQYIRIVDTVSYSTFKKENWKTIDLIVSTIDVRHDRVPSIKVNAVLNEMDIQNLKQYMQPTNYKKQLYTPYSVFEAIWPVVKKHTYVDDIHELSLQLMTKLTEVMQEEEVVVNQQNVLHEKLSADFIQWYSSAMDWRHALELAAKPLEKFHYVDENFLPQMIEVFHEKGPYMAVAPQIVLAHLHVDDAKRFGITFTKFEKGILFGHATHDPIQFVIMFVANKDNVQTDLLNQLLEKLLNDDIVHQLFQATSPKDIRYALLDEAKEKGV